MKRLRITVEGEVYDVVVEAVNKVASTPSTEKPLSSPAVSATGGTLIPAPLASVVVDIHVSVGQKVNVGDQVATIEAMKMNTIVNASNGGTVQAISVNKGDTVEEGQTLLTLA